MRIVNQNAGKDLLKEINDYKKVEVAVGLPKNKGFKQYSTNSSNVLDVGLVHEYGSISRNIPQRSFLRTPFFVKDKEIQKMIDSKLIAVFDKKETVFSSLSKIGIFAAGISQKAFTTKGYGNWKPLKEKTIERKGSSRELIDTGILRSSITYVVRKSK